MRLTLGYSDSEDRIWLRAEGSPAMWWITRRLATNLIGQWATLLEKSAVAPAESEDPDAVARRQAAATQRVRAERSQAIASTPKEPESEEKSRPEAVAESCLLSSVNLRANARAVQMELVSATRRDTVRMSRDEAHRLLHALVARAQRSGWFDVRLPDWVRDGQV